MRIRHVVLAGVVMTSVAACGESGSDSAQPTPATPGRTACAAEAATGSAVSADLRPGTPFTIRLPQLSGWQVMPTDGDDSVLNLADTGRKDGATLNLRVSTPRPANLGFASGMQGNWQQWQTNPIVVCGQTGNRAGGILPASGTRAVDVYREFLEFQYLAGGMQYPIRMMVSAAASDRDRYQPDFDTLINGLQVVAAPPAG